MKTIEELFSDLRKKRQEEFNGIQNSFALDGIWDNVVEKYSEKAHFIYEVLQNADDVGATWAKFELYQDCLVFRHNGTIHFNITPSNSEKEDYKQGRLGSLNAITATSKSTKTENSIGKFGVGFKAVFRYTKTPRIYDKDIWFAIHDYIVPERLSEDFPGRNEETVFVFPFDREPSADAVYVVPDTATCYAEIKNRLEKLKMPTLFLSTLSKVEFVCKTGSSQDGPSCGDDSSGEYSIDEDIISRKTFNADETRPRTTVKILHNKKILNGGEKFNDNLVMFSRGAAPSKKCCLCFKLDADGKIAPLNGFDAFCFFPTQHHTGLPFLVHAPFQLNDAREMLCEDSEHNRTLVDDLRNLFADSFVYLERIWKITNHRYYDDGLLDLLPLHRNETQPVKEFESFFINESANPAILKPDHPILRAFQTESVLPTGDGYTAKAHANFAETAWIIDAFPTTALRILLDDENADWAFPSTRKDKSGSADKGKSSFVEQTVCRTVDSTFIRKRLSEEIIRNCYNRLGENWLWRLHGTINDVKENVEEKKKFCQCPIFLNSNNNVCSALNADGHNILFLPSETTGEPVSGFMTVLPSSVKDTSSPTATLLKTCNATCPTKRDAVLSEVRYLLETELEEPDHLLAFQVIVADLGDLSSKDRATVISELKRCKFYGKKSNNDVCLLESSEIYFREDNLVRYFSACSEVGFLDLDKYKQALGEQHADEVESLFLELGVERLPRKKDITYTSTDKFDQEYKSRDWKKNEQSYKTEEWIEEEFDGMLAAINFLDKVQLNNGVKETCIAVWQVLVKLVHKYGENGFLNEGKHHYYRKGKWYNDTEPAPSYLLHRLRTAKWLLSKDGQQLVSAQETNVQSVLDVYAGNTPQEVALRRIIGLKDNAETRLMSELMKLNPKWTTDNAAAQMFSPSYISETLKGVAKDLPAENYILIIAGHANGWCVDEDGEYPQQNRAPMSAMTDANFNNRAITAKELAQGIRSSGVNVKAVIFDCCLTNSIEYLSELTDIPGLEYTLASGHTTKGGNYKEFFEQLYEVTNGKKDLKTALCDYAEVYARLHKEDYKLHPNDYMLMNTDFAVVDLAKLKNVWAPLKKVVDFLCENYNAADSAKYEIPSREAYQYYNKTPKYDLMDYLALMMGNGGPYETNEQYKALYNALDDIMETAIVAHAYSLNYVDETKKPKDVAEATMSMSVNIGAKGCLQYSFTRIPQYGYPCYDYKGMEWYVDPTDKDTTWYQENPQYNLYNDWQYSVDKSKFQANTGWYNWVKKNPVMPYNNPPFGDDKDHNN